MHDVPRESLGHHLGFVKDQENRNQLDERLAREFLRFILNVPDSIPAFIQNTHAMFTISKNPLLPPLTRKMKNHRTQMTLLAAGNVKPMAVLVHLPLVANHPSLQQPLTTHQLLMEPANA
jgi:hypothetical protein